MSHPQYVIREAIESDCEAIHRLIMELAIFEKSVEQVSNTVQGLKDDGFGKNSFFKCLVAETNNTINGGTEDHKENTVIGYALYFFGYSTWDGKLVYLEDLCVSTDHRGAGLGTSLMKMVAKKAADVGCVRMQWAVLGWNKDARKLYNKIGATDLTEVEDWHVLTMRKEKFIEFAKQDATSNGNILCI